MTRWTAIALIALAATVTRSSVAADHPTESKRKIVTRVMPVYPAIARTMSLYGMVKIEAVVASDGNPKQVEVKGGHPVLVQAAVDAVRKWRWESAPRESKEPIEVEFAPQ